MAQVKPTNGGWDTDELFEYINDMVEDERLDNPLPAHIKSGDDLPAEFVQNFVDAEDDMAHDGEEDYVDGRLDILDGLLSEL